MNSRDSAAFDTRGAAPGGAGTMKTEATAATGAEPVLTAVTVRGTEVARTHEGRRRAIVGVAIFALLAAAIAAFATREGSGLTPDSRGYLLVAEQIHLGNGLTMLDGDGKKVPLTHCPPQYPLMLWAGGTMAGGGAGGAGASFEQAAAGAGRAMGIALFALNVALVGMIAWRASRGSAGAATATLLAAGLTAFALDILLVHSMVWTEPMFILATFGALYFLGRFIDGGGRGMLILSAIFAAMSFGTRYAGASLVLTCGLLLMFGHPRRTWVQPFVDAFIHGAISCFLMFAFLARNAASTRDADGHAFAVHLPNRSDLKNSLITVAGWFFPAWPSDATPVILIVAMMGLGLLVAVAVLGFLLVSARRGRAMMKAEHAIEPAATTAPATAPGAGMRRAIVWFLPIYIGFVLVSVSFFDAHVPLDRRILSPVHVALIVLVAVAVATSPAWSARTRRTGVIIIALLIAFHGVRAVQWAAAAPTSRHLGYANREWRSSPTMAAVEKLPNDLTIFSNGVDAIYLRANRFARPLPKVNDPTKAARDPKFRKYMIGLREYLETNGGYVVYFNDIPRAYIVSADELLDFIPMEKISAFPDGAIYRRPPNPPGVTTPHATTEPALR